MATTINTATSTEIPQIIDTIAMAFAADPFVRWIYPDPNQYLSNIREMLIRFGGKAFDHGTAYYVDGFVGAALWLPPDIHPDDVGQANVVGLELTGFEEPRCSKCVQ